MLDDRDSLVSAILVVDVEVVGEVEVVVVAEAVEVVVGRVVVVVVGEEWCSGWGSRCGGRRRC
jgi:hypothetical protein